MSLGINTPLQQFVAEGEDTDLEIALPAPAADMRWVIEGYSISLNEAPGDPVSFSLGNDGGLLELLYIPAVEIAPIVCGTPMYAPPGQPVLVSLNLEGKGAAGTLRVSARQVSAL